jgi:hypothetical protein
MRRTDWTWEVLVAEIDLRPMTLGELLDRTFSVYKKNVWLFAGIMTVPSLLALIFQVGNSILGTPLVKPVSPDAVRTGAGAVPNPAAFGTFFGPFFLFLFVLMITYAMSHAATVFAVSDLYLGREPNIRSSYFRVWGKIFRVILVVFLTYLCIGASLIFLIIPGIIVGCRTACGIPAAMLEDRGPMNALNRSWELTKGFAFQIFVIFLMVMALTYAGAAIFTLPFTLMIVSAAKGGTLPFWPSMLQHLGSFISTVLVGPIGTIAYTLMYYNLRVRKEAFDLTHLMQSMDQSPAPLPGAPSPA